MVNDRQLHYAKRDYEQRIQDLRLWKEHQTGELAKRLEFYEKEGHKMAKVGWWHVLFGGKTYREWEQQEEARLQGKRQPWGNWGGQGPA
jgi:hypothetical protein